MNILNFYSLVLTGIFFCLVIFTQFRIFGIVQRMNRGLYEWSRWDDQGDLSRCQVHRDIFAVACFLSMIVFSVSYFGL